MQDLTKSLILLNGELKTLQIASISKLGANAFRVFFKNNPKSYTYSADKVVWLTNAQSAVCHSVRALFTSLPAFARQ